MSPLPAWLHAVAFPTTYHIGNGGTSVSNTVTLNNLPGGGFSGSYSYAGGQGTLTGISVATYPGQSADLVVAVYWSEGVYDGIELLRIRERPGSVPQVVEGCYTQNEPGGAWVGDERS